MHQLLKNNLTGHIRKRTLKLVLFFSLTLLSITIYLFIKQNNWLKKEVLYQVQLQQINNCLLHQGIYIKEAESVSRQYHLTHNETWKLRFQTALDSIQANQRQLTILRKSNQPLDQLLRQSEKLAQQKILYLLPFMTADTNFLQADSQARQASQQVLPVTDSIVKVNLDISQHLKKQLATSQDKFLKLNDENNTLATFGLVTSLVLIIFVFHFFLKLADEAALLNTGLETRVTTRTTELETANKELEAFSYSVSHDLRAPLRAIGGYSLILQEDYSEQLDSEANNCINVIIESARQMGQLIDDLLRFSQLSRLDTVKQEIDMSQSVDTVLKEMALVYDLQKYDIKVTALLPCQGDANMLRQVWINLLDNAIKYSAKLSHPAIKVGCTETVKAITYFVQDNGAGFDMAYQDKLFGVFQRLHHKDEFEGTGLGLSLVKRIIDKHKGHIVGQSTPNTETTFYFTLPKYQYDAI